jgi:hypothetical protein
LRQELAPGMARKQTRTDFTSFAQGIVNQVRVVADMQQYESFVAIEAKLTIRLLCRTSILTNLRAD